MGDARTIFAEMKAQMDPEDELRVLEKALANSFAAGVEAAASFLETSVDPTVEGHLAAEQIRSRVARPTTLEET